MNFLTRKRLRVLCIYSFNQVCLAHLSFLKRFGHIINIPRLLGLYGKISPRQFVAVGTELLPRIQLMSSIHDF